MDDLISRAGAIARIDKCVTLSGIGCEPVMAIRDVKALISVLPAVDAIPVIRCKDCEHSYFASNRTPDEQCWVCGKHGIDVTPEWYCADGGRRDEDAAD